MKGQSEHRPDLYGIAGRTFLDGRPGLGTKC
jgi:hypothetical protein